MIHLESFETLGDEGDKVRQSENYTEVKAKQLGQVHHEQCGTLVDARSSIEAPDISSIIAAPTAVAENR